MSFADIAKLDKEFESKSYVNGYLPSQDDVELFKTATAAPDAKYVNVLRWYNHIKSFSDEEKAAFPGKKAEVETAGDDDDDLGLFDGPSEEDKAILEQAAKDKAAKAKKDLSKSQIIFDVKPWDDETDLDLMEAKIKAITIEGLQWGATKRVDVGYGIKKLQVMCNVVDELVSVDDVEEKITEFDDLVQSVDIFSFNKL